MKQQKIENKILKLKMKLLKMWTKLSKIKRSNKKG